MEDYVKRTECSGSEGGGRRFEQTRSRSIPAEILSHRSGEYAEGDKMLGLSVPEQRKIALQFRDLPLLEIQKLLNSPFHEHRLIAIDDARGSAPSCDPNLKNELHRFYIKNLAGVNNWDLVDASAATLVGEHIAGNAALLRRLTRSKNLWHRRVAIVSTFAELRAGRTALTFQVSEELLDDRARSYP